MSSDQEALIDFCNAIEAACVKLRISLSDKPASNPNWDPTKIKWTQETGQKGPYERSDDTTNPEFQTMLKDLDTHQGKLNRDGRFYWVFKSGAVGRTTPKC